MSDEMSKLRSLKLRFKARMQPRALFDNRLVSRLLGMALIGASFMFFSPGRKLHLVTSAARRLDTRLMRALGKRLLRRWFDEGRSNVWREHRVGWDRYYSAFGNIARDRALTTSLLLKEPAADGEKGVLYCSFEFNWMKLIVNHDARKLFADYFLVGASSWSPSDHAVLANLCGLSDDPAFIGISNRSDIAQYRMYAPAVYPLPILACDWVDPRAFKPVAHDQRSIDILMVAHFDAWKRHWLLFEALRKMRRDLRVVLIGRNAPGRTERELREEARAFGVPQEIEILRNLEIDEVMGYQSNAKVSLALSKREGSCVSVTESMFADSPVAMMHDAHIGSRLYINPSTGRILRRRDLARGLSEMVEQSSTFAARSWANANITARASSSKLNRILREHSARAGRPWTRDIAPLCWRYVPRYLNPEDELRLRPGVERLRQQHGVTLEEFISEKRASRKAS